MSQLNGHRRISLKECSGFDILGNACLSGYFSSFANSDMTWRNPLVRQ